MASCLGCRHWKAHRPNDWEPSYAGDTFDRLSALGYMRKNNQMLKGNCTLYPEWTEHYPDHFCGQFSEHRSKTPSFDDELFGTWESRRLGSLQEDYDTLRKQLKVSREISAKRLTKIKQLQGTK